MKVLVAEVSEHFCVGRRAVDGVPAVGGAKDATGTWRYVQDGT